MTSNTHNQDVASYIFIVIKLLLTFYEMIQEEEVWIWAWADD